MNEFKKILVGCFSVMFVGIMGTSLLLSRGCNNMFNNKSIKTSSHQTESYATGISGHVEYSKYANGSQDVKIYPGWGHNMFDSVLYQDLDGDNKIDRIRENGSALKQHSLTQLLNRKIDYDNNKPAFDDADSILSDLIKKYSQ